MQDWVQLAFSPYLQKRESFSKKREVYYAAYILKFMKQNVVTEDHLMPL